MKNRTPTSNTSAINSHISGIFNKMLRLISQDALIVSYYGLVQSHLTYGLLAWGSANKTNIQSLQVLQNKIIRTMSGIRKNEHVAHNILYTSGVARKGRGGGGGGILDKLHVIFFPNHFEQPLLCYIAYLLIVNHLTVLLNAQAQRCGNGPAISFTLQYVPASIIKI